VGQPKGSKKTITCLAYMRGEVPTKPIKTKTGLEFKLSDLIACV